MNDYYECWQRKIPLPPPKGPPAKKMNWHWTANWVKDNIQKQGHGAGSQFYFLDHIPGPCGIEVLPGRPEPRFDELEIYKKMLPGRDWDAIFAERGLSP